MHPEVKIRLFACPQRGCQHTTRTKKERPHAKGNPRIKAGKAIDIEWQVCAKIFSFIAGGKGKIILVIRIGILAIVMEVQSRVQVDIKFGYHVQIDTGHQRGWQTNAIRPAPAAQVLEIGALIKRILHR